MIDSSAPPVTFNDISTNSDISAGKLFPVVHVESKLLVAITHALCSAPTVTVTSGKVAIYSTIPPFVPVLVIEGVKAVGLGDFGVDLCLETLILMLHHYLR
jgi:hypothetical protein